MGDREWDGRATGKGRGCGGRRMECGVRNRCSIGGERRKRRRATKVTSAGEGKACPLGRTAMRPLRTEDPSAGPGDEANLYEGRLDNKVTDAVT